MLPSIASLLKALDGCSHGERHRRVAELAYVQRFNPELNEWLDQLFADQGQYGAALAVHAAEHAGRLELLLRAARDPRPAVARLAVSRLSKCHPDGLLGNLGHLSPRLRLRALKSIARSGPVDGSLLDSVRVQYGPREAAVLLRGLKTEETRQYLAELYPQVKGWMSLSERHPDPVLERLRENLAALPSHLRVNIWNRMSEGSLRQLALRRPQALLEILLEQPLEAWLPTHLPIWDLAEQAPRETLQLLLRNPHDPAFLYQVLSGAGRAVRRLGRECLVRLAPHLAARPVLLADLLAGCPPSWRGELFTAAYPEVDADRVWPLELLEALPHALRVRETQRMLALPTVQGDRDRHFRIAARSDFATAWALLQEQCRAGLAEDRVRAHQLLIAACGYNRGHLAETLAYVLPRLRNDQDPVRLAACQALSTLPPSLWTHDCLEFLEQLVTAVVEARDSSWSTIHSLQHLGLALVRRGSLENDDRLLEAGLEIARRLLSRTGNISWPALDGLPRGAERALVDRLLTFLQGLQQRDQHSSVIWLAGALQRRAWALENLQSLLERATRADYNLAQSAAYLWLADPRTRDKRVRTLLDRDESSIVLERVHTHLHLKQQQWLDPFLKAKPLKGKFWSGKTVYVLPVSSGFERWLPRQQAAFGGLLSKVALDKGQSEWTRDQAVKVISCLPCTKAADLQAYLDSPAVHLQEAALAGLTRVSRPDQGVPYWFGTLDGDRARVSMYALASAVGWLPVERGTEVLRELLERPRLKVTVHKEALRLLGRYRPPGALDWLRGRLEDPKLHRDVRVAVVHALRNLLDREESWSLLELAAQAKDKELALNLLEQSPWELVDAQVRRYGALLAALLRHPDSQVRAQAALCLPNWATGQERELAERLGEALLNPEADSQWRHTVAGLLAICREGPAQASLVSLVEALLAAPEPEDPRRDLPMFQRLCGLIAELAQLPEEVRLRLGPGVLSQICQRLASRYRPLELELRAACLPMTESGPWIELCRSCAPFEELLMQRFSSLLGAAHPKPDAALAVAGELARSDCAVARRSSLLWLTRLTKVAGWNQELQSLIEQLRQDPHPLVAWEARQLRRVAE